MVYIFRKYKKCEVCSVGYEVYTREVGFEVMHWLRVGLQ
jgi:hypothetical protein